MAEALQNRLKRWTYEEYFRLEDEQRYEIIGGDLLMAPAPDTWHQEWLGALFSILNSHVKSHRLGKVFMAPVDLVLDPETTVQPDLIFIGSNNLGIIQRRATFGVPDLAIEIVSPSSVRRDRYDRKQLFARFAIKEY